MRATDFGSAKSVPWLFALLFSISTIRSADAGTIPPDYGLTWKTIGAAGNRGTLPSEAPLLPDWHPSAGSVGYEFRLTQTEITRKQWLEFVRAIAPVLYPNGGLPFALTGSGFVGLSQPYVLENFPANMSWEFAARYCNWLQNGKASTAAAFAQGVYDTSTFTRNPDGSFNHNLTHSPDAKYWIPSLDEWIKGAYYDPNKYGDGQEGYWRYPGKSDVPLIAGPPGAGGQTNAGPFSLGSPLNAGSYPDVQSAWGLLDTSGGLTELIGTPSPFDPHQLFQKGAPAGIQDAAIVDNIDFLTGQTPNSSGDGLRLASSIPSPGVVLISGISFTILHRRSRPCGRASNRSSSGSPPVCIQRPPWET